MNKSMALYGYELLYRSDSKNNYYTEDFNEDHASSDVVETIHSLGIDKITGGKKAFVNFTHTFLSSGMATLFPKEYLVVEVLESIAPSEQLVESVRQIKEKGYIIALDDFVYSEEFQPLIDLADIIKVDFINFSAANMKELLLHADLKKVTLLAEKVETREDFQRACSLGFKLFQGYFFSKPVIVEKPKINPLKMNYIQLIRLTSQEEVDFVAVSHVVRRDLSLAFKILRLVNSAYFGLRNQITDILQALAFLGEKELKKWVSLVSMMGIAEGKPSELVRMSMVRANFCEQAALSLGMKNDSEAFFIAGMFSLIDAIMDTPMEMIFAEMPVLPVARDALLEQKGTAAKMLDLLKAYEMGSWTEVAAIAEQIELDEETVTKMYVAAVTWCDQLALS